ncbi:innexin inx2 [Hyalella azteca]|uniref:Innexin n=1 Tax=Hyalella azteca TaxID=294128 RepID=A0A8B7N133_HYAAZ|nr:innexin inx2 [Hyalella azteca]
MGGPNPVFRSFNLLQQFSQLVTGAFSSNPVTHTSPSDGRILRMHYQWTLWLLLTGFACVYYNWFTRDIIVCVSHYNADVQVRLDYLNICTSYPYILDEAGKVVTLLFYRYVHWVLLLLGALYYIPRRLSKDHENVKLKRLFEYLNANGHQYEGAEKQLVDATAKYMVVNMKTHDSLFMKYWIWNVVSLGIDVFTFYFLDWLLLGKFSALGYASYPYYRDGEYQLDYISKTFPPFVECTIGMSHELSNKRVEKYGCHLTAMEIYEKVFFVLWFWLIILMVLTSVYTVFLGLFYNAKTRNLILRFSKPMNATVSSRKAIDNLSRYCKAGDYFILYKLRQHFAHKDFFELLRRICDEEFRDRVLIGLKKEHPMYTSVMEEDDVILMGSPSRKTNTGILVD